MFKKVFKKIAFSFVWGLVIFGVGFLLGLLISNLLKYPLQDVLFYVGIIVILIGLFISMKGAPISVSLQGLGSQNSALQVKNLEEARMERAIINYPKNFYKNGVFQFAFGSLSVLFGGAFILIYCIIQVVY